MSSQQVEWSYLPLLPSHTASSKSTHFPFHWGQEAELAWVTGYIPRWYTCKWSPISVLSGLNVESSMLTCVTRLPAQDKLSPTQRCLVTLSIYLSIYTATDDDNHNNDDNHFTATTHDQPAWASSFITNCTITLVQSFTAHMPVPMATSTFRLGRKQ